jgi:hypothetical protein
MSASVKSQLLQKYKESSSQTALRAEKRIWTRRQGRETRGGDEKYARGKILIKVKKLKMKSSLALLTILNWRWECGGKKEILLLLK